MKYLFQYNGKQQIVEDFDTSSGEYFHIDKSRSSEQNTALFQEIIFNNLSNDIFTNKEIYEIRMLDAFNFNQLLQSATVNNSKEIEEVIDIIISNTDIRGIDLDDYRSRFKEAATMIVEKYKKK